MNTGAKKPAEFRGRHARGRTLIRPGTLRLLLASSSVAALLIGGGSRRRLLLASSSVAALLVGGSAPSAWAQCAITDLGPGSAASVTNSAAIDCIDIRNNFIVTGNVTNTGTGLITPTIVNPTSITIFNSTIGGAVVNQGSITSRSSAAGIWVTSGATVSGGISNSGTISANIGIDVTNVATVFGGISNSGKIITTGTSGDGISVSFRDTVSGGINNSGTISVGNPGIGIVVSGATVSGGISNSGTIIANTGIAVSAVTSFGTTVSGATLAGGITNSGAISAAGIGITVLLISAFSGGITNSGTIIANTGIVVSNVSTFQGAIVNSGTIGGTGGTAIDVSGANNAITIDQTGGLISGAIYLSKYADQLNISGGAIAGDVVGSGSSDTVNFNLGSGTFTYASPYAMTGLNLVNFNSGTVYVDGSIQATMIDINNGGTAAGTGTLSAPVTVLSGGTLMPGQPLGTLNVTGSLTFDSGSTYAVQITPGANAETSVTGSATINGGTVLVTPQLGHYNATVYTIVATTGGASGMFSALAFAAPFGYTGSAALSYTTDDVDLDLGAGYAVLAAPPGAGQNQRNVVNGIDNAIIAGDTIPAGLQNLDNLSGPALLNALTQLDGEAATGAEQSAFQLMTEFLDLMLDPFVNGRGNVGGGTGGGGAIGFAPDQQANLPPDIALAYAAILKAPPPASFDQRWSAWGTAYGGSNTTSGNAAAGSNTVTASTYGFAGGMDYRVSPATVVGFALAGGGANWGLANALGSGRSDALQAGGYGITWFGPAYLAGALAFTNHWFTTNRSALGDQLTAKFDGQSYGARFEGGYRYAVLPTLGLTPYGAVQLQDFHTPSYSEIDVTGGGFGLSYNAMSATDVRSELGARFDDPTLLYGKPLILFGRLAWAHDWVSNPSLNAVFEALPGAGFTVNGAPIPQNSALTTAGAQLFLAANWSLLAKFDGEFASGSQTYAGTGTLRYTW